MSDTTDEIIEKDKTVISVVVGDIVEDLTVPLGRPSKYLAYAIADYLVNTLGRNIPFLTDPKSELILTPEIGQPFDPEKSLAAQKVDDGDTVILTSEDRNEHYPEFTSNPARGVADTQEKFFARWNAESSRRFYATVFPMAIALLTVAGLIGVLWRGMDYLRWPMVALSAAQIPLYVFIMAAVSRWSRVETGRVLVSYSAATYFAGAALGAAMVPGSPGRWHVTAAASVVLLLALILGGTVKKPIWLHYGVGAPAVVVLLVIAINIPFHGSGNVLASQLMILGFAGVFSCDKTGMTGARIKLPSMPSPGSRLRLTRAMDMVEMSRSADSGSDLTSEVNQEARAIDMHNIMVAVAGGFSALIVVSSAAAAYLAPRGQMWMQFSFIVVMALILFLFGTWAVDQGLRGVVMLAGIATMLVSAIAFALGPNTPPLVLGVHMVITLLFVFATGTRSWRDTSEMAETTARYLLILEGVLYVLPLLQLYSLMDIYTLVRELHLGS